MPTYPYLTQVVHGAARSRPDQPCLIYGARRTSNAQFRDRVARLAGGLIAAGVRPGDRVAIIALNSDRVVESFFGCFWAGAVAAPLNVRWTTAEMAYALRDCGATALLADDFCLPAAEALRREVPGLRTLVYLGDGPVPEPMAGYEDLISAGPAVPDAGRAGDDLAFVLYTGGTTGFPKGVMLSHANLLAATTGMLAAGCGTGEVYLHAPPLFHIAGVQVMAGHFLGGRGPHVIIPAFSPAAVLAAIAEHQVTDVMLVPTMLQLVLADPGLAGYDLSSLQRIFYGAAPMTEPLLRAAMAALPGMGFVQGYGMTETALTIMLPPEFYTPEGQRLGKISSIGRALPTAEVAIRDADGREVPAGTVGELTVRSPSVMLGYYGNPELTADTIRDGWLYSGDGAYADPDGFIHLVDRIKDMIITGAENVYSTEVETALAAHPAVASCAVIGIPHPTWGEALHAVVVLRPDAAPASAQDLIGHCQSRIAGYKCPRSIDFRDALPTSAAGKVLKTRLRADYAKQEAPHLSEESGAGSSIPARRAALLDRFAVWAPVTLSEFLHRTAAEYGDRPFVITDERSVSYAEVDAWASELADGLASLGVRPGDRVGMLMANYLEFVPLKFAIARTGAVAIPFNYLYRQAELGYVLRQSRCNVLITMTGFSGLDYPAMLDAIAPGWAAGPASELPDLRQVVLLDTGAPARDGVLDVAGLAELGRRNGGAADATSVTPDSPGDILYTSGTTGLPKGVVVTHDAVLRTSYGSALTRAYQDGRRILFSLPCYHMFGYVEGLLSVMFVGGAIIPRTSFSPADYCASIERHRATEILAVPTMTVALLEYPGLAASDLSSLTAILSGAAPAPVWLWRKVQAELGVTEITTGYGMTECGGAMTLTLPEDPLEFHSSTVGRPKLAAAAGVPGGDLCVYKTVDPVTGEDLPDGAEGELASTGPTHMLGYWDKPEETAQALRGGWVYSGDLGVVQPDGYLRVTGRSKELYKSGGELVMPKEIEDLLTQHPGVSQAFVVGVADERWGDVGCAWIVPEPGAVPDPGELIALCKEKLARFKVPRHFYVLEPGELPTTPTGKVQKYRLAQRASARIAAG